MHGRATNEVSDQPSCSRKRTILFAEVFRLICDILAEACHEAYGRQVLTGTGKAAATPRRAAVAVNIFNPRSYIGDSIALLIFS
jgi:hypothetical protein